ncbi:MAG: hypothetical protein HY365_02955 [Candidatus Aenigmarchaeota archaeon]|nr:hypothetical protein [Candidatus Aenigmarchaeota archaeon]
MSSPPYETVVHEYHIGPADAKLLECIKTDTVSGGPVSVTSVAIYAALTQGRPDILKGSDLITDSGGGLVVTPFGRKALNYFHVINGNNFY